MNLQKKNHMCMYILVVEATEVFFFLIYFIFTKTHIDRRSTKEKYQIEKSNGVWR